MADPPGDAGKAPAAGGAVPLTDRHLDWMAQFTGLDPRVKGGGGLGITGQLTLGLAGDEPAKCTQFLDAHMGVTVQAGGSPGRAADYGPTLDGKPAAIRQVVDALLPLTTAGFSVANGGSASGPLCEGTVAQLTKLVQEQMMMKLALPLALAAAKTLVTLPNQIDGAPPTVPRAAVERALTDFLKQVMAAQKARSVRITEPVRLAVMALTQGLPGLAAGVPLPTSITTGDPAQLAAQIVKPLPDPFPAANLAAMQRVSAKEFAAPNLSASDLLAKLVGKEVNAAIGLLPKKWQDTVRDGVADAIASGIAGGLDKALKDAPLDQSVRDAIKAGVEAALKQKERGPPMDSQADGAGSPYAPVQPPAAAPPIPDADGVITSPPINLP